MSPRPSTRGCANVMTCGEWRAYTRARAGFNPWNPCRGPLCSGTGECAIALQRPDCTGVQLAGPEAGLVAMYADCRMACTKSCLAYRAVCSLCA